MDFLCGCIMCQVPPFGLIANHSRLAYNRTISWMSTLLNQVCIIVMKGFLLINLLLCFSVSHAEVHDIYSELNEEREAICISRRSNHLVTGKLGIWKLNLGKNPSQYALFFFFCWSSQRLNISSNHWIQISFIYPRIIKIVCWSIFQSNLLPEHLKQDFTVLLNQLRSVYLIFHSKNH